jgi:hypothetical protein
MHVGRKRRVVEVDDPTLGASVVRIVREQAGETGFFQLVSIWDVSSAQLMTIYEQGKLIGKAYRRNLCCLFLLFTQHVYSGVNCEDLKVAIFKPSLG